MGHLILRQGDTNYWKYSLLPFGILLLLCLIFMLVRGCNKKEMSETFCVEAEVIQGEDTTTAVDTNTYVPCNAQQESGGQGYQEFKVNLGSEPGMVYVQYDMQYKKDDITIIYDGKVLHNSGLIRGSHEASFYFPGSKNGPSFCEIIMQAPEGGTVWEFIVACPN